MSWTSLMHLESLHRQRFAPMLLCTAIAMMALCSGVRSDNAQEAVINVQQYQALLKECLEQLKWCVRPPRNAKHGEGGEVAKVLGQIEAKLSRINRVEAPNGMVIKVTHSDIISHLRTARRALNDGELKRASQCIKDASSRIEAILALSTLRAKVSQRIDRKSAQATLKNVLSQPEFNDPWENLRKLVTQLQQWLSRTLKPIMPSVMAVLRFIGRILTPIGRALVWLGQQFVSFLAWIGSLPLSVMIAIAIVLLIILICYLLHLLAPYRPRLSPSVQVEPIRQLRQEDPRTLLVQAEAVAERGDYTGALKLVYLALLISLDRLNLLRFDESRTNWEYIEHLRRSGNAHIAKAFEPITQLFDRCVYAQRGATQDEYQHVRVSYEHILRVAQS